MLSPGDGHAAASLVNRPAEVLRWPCADRGFQSGQLFQGVGGGRDCRFGEARRIARTRRELAAFDERLLRDIGIDRAGAFAERAEQEPVLAQRPIATEPAVQSRFVVGGAAASAEAANDRQPAERVKPAAA